MSGPEFGIDDIGQNHPHEKGDDDTCMTDDEGFACFAPDDTQIEFHSDDEHEEHESDLADHVERNQRFGSEQEREGLREEVPQHRGAQNNAGNDLSDHTRLPEVFEQIGEDPDGDHDRDNLQQQQRQRMIQISGQRSVNHLAH